MRIALITEGAYPHHHGPASTWCHQLVSAQPRHAYQLVALTAEPDGPPVYQLPPNVTGLSTVPVWGRPSAPPGRLARLRNRRAATSAAVLFCRGLLGDGRQHTAMMRDGLVRLAHLAADGTHPLHGTPLADVLLDAWRATRDHRRDDRHHRTGASRSAGGGPTADDFQLPLPRLSVRDADAAAVLLEHALRPLAIRVDDVDLCHATAGGLPLLVALATRWRTGTPYLLTEHGIYLRERYLDYGPTLPAAVNAVMLRFFRALSALGYAEAALVVAGSRFNQRWQLRHGAHPARVVVVSGGVDPGQLPRSHQEPAEPVVVWRGQLDGAHDLRSLIRAVRPLQARVPAVRLLLYGEQVDPWFTDDCRDLIARLGLGSAVTLATPPAQPVDAYASGQVVAVPQLSEGTPHALIEAMMCGRPTVSVDVGAAAEVTGDTGLLVPPGDPAALAAALAALLTDPPRRRQLAAAAHQRAWDLYRLDQVVRAYDQLYLDAAGAAVAGTR